MKAASHSSKDVRIDLRVHQAQKAPLSDFVITGSTEAAGMALADQNRLVIPEEMMAKFMAILEEEPRENPALSELFARKGSFE